jgi:hypothetical protein
LTVGEASGELARILEREGPRLAAITETESLLPPEGMSWCRKEILGHLIDSAGNNHQRFVRAQLQSKTAFPPYAQERWVAVQGYRERPWGELVELWRLYNRHLLHVMRRVPEAAWGNVCTVAADEPSTLGDHLVDYVNHLEHHLRQILLS